MKVEQLHEALVNCINKNKSWDTCAENMQLQN